MRNLKNLLCLLLFMTVSFAVYSQTKNDHKDIQSPRDFVQNFYNWYVPIALGDTPVSASDASDIALKEKSIDFIPTLRRALREDSVAQAKVKDEIVGLDFDPFLAAQDPCDRYEVAGISLKNESYWVEVYGVCSGTKNKKPDVVAELRRKDDSWVFVNFHYPEVNSDLLSTLKLLKKERH